MTKPLSTAKAYCHAKADTTVMIDYGTRIAVRRLAAPLSLVHHEREREAEDELDHDRDHHDFHV